MKLTVKDDQITPPSKQSKLSKFTEIRTPNKSAALFSDDDSDMDYFISLASPDSDATSSIKPTFNRYKIDSIDYSNQDEPVLNLLNTKTNNTSKCTLKECWSDTENLKPGDLINKIETENLSQNKNLKQRNFSINTKQNFLILNPDHLISTTELSTAFFCQRKAFLDQKFKVKSSMTESMILGCLIHDLFQQAMINNWKTQEELENFITLQLKSPSYLLNIAACDGNESEIFNQARPYITNYLEWTTKSSSGKINKENLYKPKIFSPKRKITSKYEGNIESFDIENLVGVESNIWSPNFGLKGRIDMVVDVRTKDGQLYKNTPLELKTGKASFSTSHTGQTMLYSMMMTESQSMLTNFHDSSDKISKSILFYLKTGDSQLIRLKHNEIRDMVMARNNLESFLCRKPKSLEIKEQTHENYIKSMPRMPYPINRPMSCSNCEMNFQCSLMLSTFGPLVKYPPNHPMNHLMNEKISHLTNADFEFFVKWYHFLETESFCQEKSLSQIWNEDLDERIATGACLANLKIDQDSLNESLTNEMIVLKSQNQDLTKSEFQVGDYCVLSKQNSLHFADDMGKISEMTESTLKIESKQNIYRQKYLNDDLYRIDHYNPQSTFQHNHTFLSEFMSDNEKCKRLRDTIISKKQPTLKNELSNEEKNLLEKYGQSLNLHQQEALRKSILFNDFLLINGYPGTGKTTTIACIAATLASLGKKVLISALTNCALDHILKKIGELNIDYIRFGPKYYDAGKLSLCRENYIDEIVSKSANSSVLNQKLKSNLIFGSTSVSTGDQLIRKVDFDVAIIDEASQLFLTSTLGPLTLAEKFILVGDPNQLPPIVTKENKNKLPNLSLFTHLLALDQKNSRVDLVKQYRMNEKIMAIPNQLIYNNVLECGSNEVATKNLQQYFTENIDKNQRNPNWLMKSLSSAINDSVLFLNYSRDIDFAKEFENVDFTTKNIFEAEKVLDIIQGFHGFGLKDEDVGVISPYNAQVKLLKALALRRGVSINANTVDRFQGQDKLVIIISFVKSYANSEEKINAQSVLSEHSILNDFRRINVAITRAKCKLIMIGDSNSLKNYEPLSKMINICTEENSIIKLT